MNKWNYVPNGILISDWQDAEPIGDDIALKLENIRKRFSKVIAYTGSFGLANALDNFLIAASKMKGKDIAFVLVGSGPEKQNLINLKEKLDSGNVFFVDSVPKTQIPDLLSYFDFLYIGLQKQSLFRFGISPNKLIDYMMSSKPVIQAIDAGNDMVKEAECGISIPPEEPDKLVKACEELMAFPEE